MRSYKKDIRDCLSGVAVISFNGKPSFITNLQYDSRKVSHGAAFFALNGLHQDGKSFIDDAIKNGALVIIYEGSHPHFMDGIYYIKVRNIRESMACIASNFYEEPASSLCVIGVTGTEGKSSTTSFIYQLLSLCKKKAGFVSTVSYSYGDETHANPEHQTTPESTQVFEHLAHMRDNGVSYAILESSSHGLSKKTARLFGIPFDVGVCLNIKEEHLEFHKTLECYKSDKANLFRMMGSSSYHKKNDIEYPTFAVINEDDDNALYLKNVIKSQLYSFTIDKKKWDDSLRGASKVTSKENLFFISDIKEEPHLNFALTYLEKGVEKKSFIKSHLCGEFNAYNLAATLIVVSKLLSCSIEEIAFLVEKISSIKGRMKSIELGQDFEVIIDYAHTPSSFLAIFPSIKEKTKKRGGRVISLFGSGGERDVVKRGEQGRIASIYSDIIILADEDPRGEDSVSLLEMIAKGVEGKMRDVDLFIIPKREEAIKKAFSIAKKGDVVLLLGKGHENSIIFKDYVQPYDEEETATQILKTNNFYVHI